MKLSQKMGIKANCATMRDGGTYVLKVYDALEGGWKF